MYMRIFTFDAQLEMAMRHMMAHNMMMHNISYLCVFIMPLCDSLPLFLIFDASDAIFCSSRRQLRAFSYTQYT